MSSRFFMNVTVPHLVNENGDFQHLFIVTPKQGDGTTRLWLHEDATESLTTLDVAVCIGGLCEVENLVGDDCEITR